MTTFDISIAALQSNYKTLQSKTEAEVSAVVKADGYGLGAAQVADAFSQADCSKFFVAHISEGIELRKTITDEIYILHGIQSKEQAAECTRHNLTPILNNNEQLEFWQREKPCALHFDTGMTRLGFAAKDAEKLKGYNARFIMSHLSCAEDVTDSLNEKQLEEFQHIAKFFPVTFKSLCNSAGIFLDSKYHFDITRPGIALYGGLRLKNVVSLHVPILQINKIESSRTVGYGATYVAEKGDIIATLECGYADIMFRTLANKGKVYVSGIACPIVGRISMDLITIKINNLLPELQKVGQMVEILGDNYTICDMADDAETIPYEILTKLGHRYKRRYV
jgi:alanine racemase